MEVDQMFKDLMVVFNYLDSNVSIEDLLKVGILLVSKEVILDEVDNDFKSK